MKRYWWKILIYMFVLELLFACVDKKKQYVRHWYGRAITLPDTMTFRLYAQDKISFDYFKEQYKIIIFIGSMDCISCKLKIDDWQRFIEDIDSAAIKVDFLFFMDPIYRRELYTILKSHEFSIPVCIDDNASIRLLNNVPLNSSHVFLLDQQNQIIGVGDPISNKNVRKLYKKILNKKL